MIRDLASTVEHICQLNADLGVPKNLSGMDVGADKIPILASHTVKNFCTFTSPRPHSVSDYMALYKVAIEE